MLGDTEGLTLGLTLGETDGLSEALPLTDGDADGDSDAEPDIDGLTDADRLMDGDADAEPEIDGLTDADRLILALLLIDGDALGDALTVDFRNTNIPTIDSIPESTLVTSGVPVVVPAVGNVWLATDKTPLPPTFTALSAQLPPGIVTLESVLIAQHAKANAPFVAVVTAGQFGLVSFANAAHAPVPAKLTSCGVSGSTPDNDPIHQPTCSLAPSLSNV